MQAAVNPNNENRSMAELGSKLAAIKDVSGTSYQSIATETGVNRSIVSQLANNGRCGAGQETLDRLWDWVNEWEASQGMAAPAAETAEPIYKTEPELIRTNDLLGALGFCDFCVKHRELGVVTGMPGTGKTTVANIMKDKLPHVILIEAWLSMRLGDLLNKLGKGLGIRLRGTQTEQSEQIIEELRQRPDTVILVDEAEYLKKWNIEKIEVLRKIRDHANVALIMFGTPTLLSIIARNDATQLSRRVFSYRFDGASKSEVKQALQDYNMEPSVAERLAAIAADTNHGGMGSYTKMLELCLYSAQGGRITDAALQEAVLYKPGL